MHQLSTEHNLSPEQLRMISSVEGNTAPFLGVDSLFGIINLQEIPNLQEFEVDGDSYVELRSIAVDEDLMSAFASEVAPVEPDEEFISFPVRYLNAKKVMQRLAR